MENSLPKEQSLIVIKIAAFIIIIAGIIFAKAIVIPLLLALFLSIICEQPIYWLQTRKVPKGLAIFIVLIGIVALFLGIGYMVGGAVSSFTSNTPGYTHSLNEISDTFINYLNGHGIQVTHDQFSKLFEPSSIIGYTAFAVNQLINMMGNTFLIFLTVLFILLEISSIPDKLKAIHKGPAESMDFLSKIIRSIRHYLGIKTVINIVIGVLIYIALTIIGLDNAILWALIAALLNYIPNIGSIISVIPAIIMALIQLGTGGAIWVLISFTAIHNILGNMIEPKIMGQGLGLSTLVVFISLVFWGFILGIVGMFLAVPLTISIKIVLEQNEDTKWIAILLGTPKDAKIHIENRNKEKQD
jgi:AI-2 transport protein TqsA